MQPARGAAQLAAEAAELASQGSYEQAAALFHEALAQNPGHAAAWEMLAQCNMAAGLDEAAYEAAREAAQRRAGWAPALLTLGRAARNTGRLKDAAAALEGCLACAESQSLDAAADAERQQELQQHAELARQELADVQELLQLQLGYQLGLPGLRLAQRHGAAAGPGAVVWEAGALLAWFLVQQQGTHTCGPSGCSAQAPAADGQHPQAQHPHDGSGPEHSRERGFLHGSRVLELGSGGTGIVGLTAACLGAAVTATDLAEVLPQLRASVTLNHAMVEQGQGSVQVAALDWREPAAQLLCPHPPALQYDWLMGADLVYNSGAVQPLAATVGAAVQRVAAAQGNPDSTTSHPLKLLICHKQRHADVDSALLAALAAAGAPLHAILKDPGTRCTVYANAAARSALGI